MGHQQGAFILSVRRDGKKLFGELARYSYDEGALRKAGRRPAVKDEAMAAMDGWQTRYHRFADASFRIEEAEAYGHKRALISGPSYTEAEAAENH